MRYVFFSFSFFKHFRVKSIRAQQTNINDQVGGLGPPQIKLLPSNLNV